MDTSPGTLLLITRRASVQFTTPFLFRVISVIPRETYYGWVWLEGYQLDGAGTATSRRAIFVMRAGLRPGRARQAPSASRPNPAGNATPHRPRGHQPPPRQPSAGPAGSARRW